MAVSDDEFYALKALVTAQADRIAMLEEKLEAAHAAPAANQSPALSRRGLFGMAVAGAALGLAQSTARANAADGDQLNLGGNNTATSPTTIRKSPDNTDSFGFGVTDGSLSSVEYRGTIYAHNAGSFTAALVGEDYSKAQTGKAGVYGLSTGNTGVIGVSAAVTPSVKGTGVSGQGWFGVIGNGIIGVAGLGIGDDKPSTMGVYAATLGKRTALAVNGIVRFTRTGTFTIAAKQTSRSVTVPNISGTSIILTSIQKGIGNVVVARCLPKTTGKTGFTVRLSGPAPTGGLVIRYVIIDSIGDALGTET